MLVDREILRHVAFVEAPGCSVYAALYAPESAGPAGVVISPSWGADVALAIDASHRLASTLAEHGVAAALYHPPGHLDSPGDPRDVTTGDLVAALAACAELLREHCSVRELRLVGIGLGASVAALAAAGVGARSLVLVEPALDPAAFFAELRRASTRTPVRDRDPEMPFGHALPRADTGDDVAARVAEAFAEIPEGSVAFRFGANAATLLPAGVEEFVVAGGRTGRRWPNRFVEPVSSFLIGAGA